MERDWSLSGACYGLQSRTALHNPGCAIKRLMEHVRLSSNNGSNPYRKKTANNGWSSKSG